MSQIFTQHHAAARARVRGSAIVEYVVVTSVSLAALLLPFGSDSRSALQRLIGSIQQEHAGYLYAASVPNLPQGNVAGHILPPGGGMGAGNDETSPDATTPGGASGSASSDGSSGPGTAADGGGSGVNGGGDQNAGGADAGAPETPDDSPVDPDPLVDADADGETGNGAGSCPVPGMDDLDGGADAPFASASQRTGVASTQVGNPIHVGTGNKYQREVDLRLPAPQLSFVRHYNSRSSRRGALGTGWTHGFETRLLDMGDRATLWQADGRRIDFRIANDERGVRHFVAAQYGDGRLTADRGGYEWRWRDRSVLSFDRSRQLRQIRDASGRSLRLMHDARGRLILVKNEDDVALELRYDADGHLGSVLATDRVVARYAYDDRGNLAAVHYPDRRVRRYHYDDPHDPHNLTGISSDEGTGLLERIGTWAYDAEDRGVLYEPADASDRLELAYQGPLTRVISADRSSSDYAIGTRSGVPVVKSIRGPGCSPCSAARLHGDVRFAYNEALQLTTMTSSDGMTRTYDHDALGRLTRVAEGSGTEKPTTLLRMTYSGDSDQIETIAKPSVRPNAEHTIHLRYRDDGQIEERMETGYAPLVGGGYAPIERRQLFEYDREGLTAVGGFRPGIESPIRFVRDAVGLMSGTDFPDGGALRVVEWDDRGRARRVAVDGQPALTLNYGSGGQIESVQSDRGHLQFEYGPSGQLRSVRDRSHPPAEIRFDLSKDRRFARSVQWPPSMDGAGPRSPQADRLPAAVFDRFGNLASVTDGNGGTTRYGVDDFGRRVFAHSSDSGVTVRDHDEENNLISVTDASNGTATFQYDAGRRLIEARLPDARTRFRRDALGSPSRVTAVERDGSSVQIEYDAAGRVTRRVTAIGKRSYASSYRYGALGELTSRTLPDGRTLHYRYRDTVPGGRQLSEVVEARWLRDVPLITDLENRATHAETSGWVAGNGIQTAMRRARGRLVGLRIGGLHDLAYGYDRRGRITLIDDRGRTAARYRYDSRDRLDFALTPSALYGYRYDANGNRTRQVENGRHTQYEYAPAGNRLWSVHAEATAWFPPMLVNTQALLDGSLRRSRLANLDHDALDRSTSGTRAETTYRPGGEIETLGTLRFTYDANGQITEAWRGPIRLARYRYDAQARRISKQTFNTSGIQTAERHFLYEDGQLSAEADASGAIDIQYLYVGRHPAVMLSRDTLYFIHTNHLGAPIAVTDQTRKMIWRADYAPFGRAIVDDDPDGDGARFTLNLRLPGQYEDAETGLHYNHHRYYDPDLGRYLSPDPLGLSAGLNPYVYAGNDPVNNIDPDGLLLFAFDGTGNNDPALGKRDISNVVKFRDSYLGDPGEMGVRTDDGTESDRHYFYISGPGTTDARTGIRGDARYDGLTGSSMIDRIAALADDFFDHMAWLHINRQKAVQLNVDTIGFSRGAAQARIFVNLLTAFLNGEDHFVLDHGSGRRYEFGYGDPSFVRNYMRDSCVGVHLRFLGLFDTVPHYSANQPHLDVFGTSQDDDLRELDLHVDPADAPHSVGYVAHAVAANENRRDFHAISIHSHPLKGNTEARMEMGFIGAHADIGGGYSEGDLSDVALMWMVKRASEAAGVSVSAQYLRARSLDVVTSPVLHDSKDAKVFFRDGRVFKYTNGVDRISQRRWYHEYPDPDEYGMDYGLSSTGFYNEDYKFGPRPMRGTEDHEGNPTLVGLVHSQTYSSWLQENYGLSITMDTSDLDENMRPPAVQ